MKPRFAYLLVALALVAAAAAAFVWLRRPAEVQGARTTIGRAIEVVYATGFVEPRQPVEAAARVTAPIAEVLAEEGQRVARGQPLVRLEDDEQRQAIAQLAAAQVPTSSRRVAVAAMCLTRSPPIPRPCASGST